MRKEEEIYLGDIESVTVVAASGRVDIKFSEGHRVELGGLSDFGVVELIKGIREDGFVTGRLYPKGTEESRALAEEVANFKNADPADVARALSGTYTYNVATGEGSFTPKEEDK
jgi:hypothetical protein